MERLSRLDTRAILAQELMRRPELEGQIVNAKLIERIEATGQRPTREFMLALGALYGMSLTRVRALFRRAA
jgi:hypothetical protein